MAAVLLAAIPAFLTLVIGCQHEPAQTTGWAEISLIDLFDRAERTTTSSRLSLDKVLAKDTTKLAGKIQRVIRHHPTGTLSYRLRIPRDAVLRFGCCMSPHTWKKSPDGIRFHLRARRIRAGGRPARPITLLSLALDPLNKPAHRRIFEQQVDLETLGGGTWELIFTLSHGPRKDVHWDNGFWVEPRLEYPSASVEVPAPDPARPDILLVTVDSLRADVLASLADHEVDGPAIAAAPVIAGLAAEGLRAAAAFTPSTLTIPSYASILTGAAPADHGLHRGAGRYRGDLPTAGNRFAEQGYRTAAFLGSSQLAARRTGLTQGFENVDSPPIGQRPASETVLGLLDWIRQDDGRPWFCWLQFNELQPPLAHLRDRDRHYYPRGGFNRWDESILRLLPHFERRLDLKERWYRWLHDVTTTGYVEASYLGTVDELDRQLGRVIEELRARSQLKQTVVAVTANRGLALGEQGIHYTGESLQPGTTRVPLIIRLPGRIPITRLPRRSLCTTADILPTLLGLLPAMEPDHDSTPPTGIDLLATLRDSTPLEERKLFLEGHIGPPEWPNRFALVAGGFKLAESAAPYQGSHPKDGDAPPWSRHSHYHNIELFNLLTDPAEKDNLDGSRPLADLQHLMHQQLRSMIPQAPSPPAR